MLPIFAMCCAGCAAGGLLCRAAKHVCLPRSDVKADQAAAAAAADSSLPGLATNQALPRRLLTVLMCHKDITGVVCACVAAAATLLVARQHNKSKSGKGRKSRIRTDGRIPLQDLVRFKERQWFVEELENARDADPMSMLRLAKMYLHGQGCQRNIALAQEWVRKARSMGVPSTLDELFATDDPDPRGKLRALMAQEEKRRALRRTGPAGTAVYHQQYTAAA